MGNALTIDHGDKKIQFIDTMFDVLYENAFRLIILFLSVIV